VIIATLSNGGSRMANCHYGDLYLTLELGIDIGDVTCVAQIGAPFSVALSGSASVDLGAALASRRSCANMLLKPRSTRKAALRTGSG
jgi:hypothetical protein